MSRIQFKFSQKAFVDFWNATEPPLIQYGTIALYKDSVEYARLAQAVHSFYAGEQTWKELIEVEYTSKDLSACELLSVWINGDVGTGGNQFGNVYEMSQQCVVCGQTTIIGQKQNPILDSRKFVNSDENTLTDLNRTDFNDEIIISAKLRKLLEDLRVNGIDFRSIDDSNSALVEPIAAWYQLIIHNQTGLFATPTQLFGTGRCEACSELRLVQFDVPHGYLVSQASEPYFQRFAYEQYAIFLSTQRFQNRDSSVGRSAMIISRDLYLALQDANITGFWVQPAHLL